MTLTINLEIQKALERELDNAVTKYNPENIFIEYNGTWEVADLVEEVFPESCELVQVLTTVDAMNCLNSIALKNKKSVKKQAPVKETKEENKKENVELDDIYDFIDELEVMKNGK